MLTAFGTEIWIADGPQVVAAIGFPYPTRMAVVRLNGGDLFVWSPTALTPELRAEVDALGRVAYLVAPNTLHDTFIADWKRAYPAAVVHAAPGLAAKRTDIAFDAELGETPAPGWAGEIEQVVFGGNAITTEIVFFHRASGTVLFTDLLQQFPPGWFSGWRAFIARWDLMVSPRPAVPRKFRIAFRKKALARAAIGKVLAWPAQKVIMAHGAPVTEGGRDAIADAFRWLTG
ncbi:MAG: DUF4336 domain-containing protein [Rhizobiaceae bacterium]